MSSTAHRTRMIALVASTALASMALAGCSSSAAPRADLSAGKAQEALAKGKANSAIEHAEAAVLAEPRNAAYRAMLGATYMEAGRFQSAATTFKDAMALGDSSPRIALSYALAEIAAGNSRAALATLEQWRDDIDPADLGLALALAGQPDRGIHVLGNAVRSGHNTPKVRQNLAYAYALQGNWSAARIMAAEDVPADQLDERLSEWARVAQPEAYQQRVASLLAVPVTSDSGQPAALALNNNPGTQMLAAEAASQGGYDSGYEYADGDDTSELPALAAAPAPRPATRTADFEAAFAAPAPAAAAPAQAGRETVRYVSSPVVQPAPAPRVATARRAVAAPEPSAAPVPGVAAAGTHLVQLGSFSSEASAKRAWGIYSKRYPQLRDHDMVITRAIVRGKTYYRVSAAGFASNSSRSMCSTVRQSGHGCIAWAAGKPLPGAVDNGIRVASR